MDMKTGQGSSEPTYKPLETKVREKVDVQYRSEKTTYEVERILSSDPMGGRHIESITMTNMTTHTNRALYKLSAYQ